MFWELYQMNQIGKARSQAGRAQLKAEQVVNHLNQSQAWRLPVSHSGSFFWGGSGSRVIPKTYLKMFKVISKGRDSALLAATKESLERCNFCIFP